MIKFSYFNRANAMRHTTCNGWIDGVFGNITSNSKIIIIMSHVVLLFYVLLEVKEHRLFSRQNLSANLSKLKLTCTRPVSLFKLFYNRQLPRKVATDKWCVCVAVDVFEHDSWMHLKKEWSKAVSGKIQNDKIFS